MNKHKAALLRLLHAKADLASLLEEGLLYSQITQLLGELIDERFVTLLQGAPELTEAGLAVLRTDEATGDRRRDGGFIGAMDSARIDKLGVDSIYLPVRRHSFF